MVTVDKNEGIFDLVNFTKTPMGKRFLFDQMSNPSANPEELNQRYRDIKLIKSNNEKNKKIFFFNFWKKF